MAMTFDDIIEMVANWPEGDLEEQEKFRATPVMARTAHGSHWFKITGMQAQPGGGYLLVLGTTKRPKDAPPVG